MKYFLNKRHRRIQEKWNCAISLEDNSFFSVAKAVGAERRHSQVFPGSDNFIFLGDNLVAQMPFGLPFAPDTPVIQLTLVLYSGYFQGSSQISTKVLPGFELGRVSLRCSAAGCLKALEQSGHAIATTGTEMDKYTIEVGAITIECPFEEPMAPPERAYPAAIHFCYQYDRARKELSPQLTWR